MSTDRGTRWGYDVMELLRQHVPIALLVDLADPSGPPSREIVRAERMVAA